MRRKLVAGNWKLHGSQALVRSWTTAARMAALAHPACDLAVLPPAPYLLLCSMLAEGSPLLVGAQNVSEHSSGAWTGEMSAAMAVDCGAQLILVGHSERRQFFSETAELTALKFAAVQATGACPVLCVGENLAERDADRTLEVVASQLAVIIAARGVQAFNHAVVAYEPVWAIGTGRTATAMQAQQVHCAIRSQIAGHDAKVADSLRILYGGSVKASNAASLMAEPDVDGALVGGASLDPAEFAAIVAAAS